MIKITIERNGELLEVIETEAYLAAGIGETTEEGTSMHQMLVAEGISETEMTALLATVISTIHKTVNDPNLGDAIIQYAVAKAKMSALRENEGETTEKEIHEINKQ